MRRRIIRLLTSLIPAKSLRKRIRRRLLDAERLAWLEKAVPSARRRAKEVEARCRGKLDKGERLKVAFLVSDASMFSGESVFAAMAKDGRFECEIAVAPRVTRGETFLRETLAKTVGSLERKFPGRVRPLYNPDTKEKGKLDADIVFSTVLYEDQTFSDWTTERLSERSLVVILYYGYGGLFFTNEKKTPFLPNVVLAWRYFVSNEATREMSVRMNPALGPIIKAVGYTKMDRLAGMLQRGGTDAPGRRKKIVLSPHHSIDATADGLALSTFLKNHEMYLRLPEMFPEIDFVFRPHPLLFARLETPKWWGKAKTDAYKEKIASFPNVEFQQGGDYFATFADSDALIHDCGSFLAEYFYTGKPQCYLLESEETVEKQFLPFSRRLLDHATRAFREEDVFDFIRRVVVAGEDPHKKERDEFAEREVCVGYPHATESVIAAVVATLR